MEKINQFTPSLGDLEIESVVGSLKANWITEGPKTELMENMLSGITGAKHVIMFPNGTLSLYGALMVNGIGAGDEVIVPDFTFVGSASSICLTGARPVFAEVRKSDFNIDVSLLDRYLTSKTKAIMPVHIYGQPVDMDPLLEFAKKNNLKVIEDAAQGIGVFYQTSLCQTSLRQTSLRQTSLCQTKHVGTFGDAGCISFFADKTITTGEGGAILTNSDEIADKCMYFKNQGRLKRGTFQHPYVGFNFRITDLQAAIGVVQLKRLDEIIEKKNKINQIYVKYLADCPEVTVLKDNGLGVCVPFRINILTSDSSGLIDYMGTQGIGARTFFYPLHMQPCFNNKNSRAILPYVNSKYAFDRGISLPSGIDLTEIQIKRVCDEIKKFSSIRFSHKASGDINHV